MSTSRNTSQLSSSEKKRLRDRKAQQTLREKRQNRLLELEARVAFCEENHGGNNTKAESKPLIATVPSGYGVQDVHQLLETVEKLRLENNRLRERQENLRRMVGAWDSDEQKDQQPEPSKNQNGENRAIGASSGLYEGGTTSEIDYRTSSSPATDNPPIASATALSPSPSATLTNRVHAAYLYGVSSPKISTSLHQFAGSICSPQDLPANAHPIVHLPSPPAVSTSLPVWCRVPRNTYETNNTHVFPSITSRWFSHPELIAPCPPEPSPLDLMHGTRRNYLANYIHDSIRLRAIRDAECLAFGYLLYSYSKWRVSPTPATFARLAPFQHPIPIQLEQDHFSGIDLMIWPQMRVNIIRHWGKVNLLELFDFLAACMKVRWPWNKDMLERDADDNLRIRQDFKLIFHSEDGWGLTAEFIDRYPMLLEGMDVEALRFEITFPTEMYSY